jgi:hypothetical protein
VPFNSFAELDNGTFGGRAPVWFALDESRPTALGQRHLSDVYLVRSRRAKTAAIREPCGWRCSQGKRRHRASPARNRAGSATVSLADAFAADQESSRNFPGTQT